MDLLISVAVSKLRKFNFHAFYERDLLPSHFFIGTSRNLHSIKKLSGGRSSSQNNTSPHQQNKNTMVSAFRNISQLPQVNILNIVTNLHKNKTPPAFVRLTGFAKKPLKIASTKATSLPKRGKPKCKRFAFATIKEKHPADFSHEWRGAYPMSLPKKGCGSPAPVIQINRLKIFVLLQQKLFLKKNLIGQPQQ